MPSKLTIDPLWQCLCPSWRSLSLARSSRQLRIATGVRLTDVNRGAPAVPARQARYYNPAITISRANAARKHFERAGSGGGNMSEGQLWKPVYRVEIGQRAKSKEDGRWVDATEKRQDTSHDVNGGDGVRGQKRLETFLATDWMELRLSKPQHEEQAELDCCTTANLYTRLSALALNGEVVKCRRIVEYLLREREERPSARLYHSLITSNLHYMDGTAWRVGELLEEMADLGIPPDVGTCHAALKALSVHPDHLLRSGVLEHMKKKWFQLSEDGAHDVTVGLLREGLYEQALERLEIMKREGVLVPPWLADLTVYALCNVNEPEEGYRIMRARHDSGELSMSRNVWYTLLDTSSSMRHHAGTSFVWTNQVGTGYFNPASEICLNVLTTAAKSGNAVLATDVFSHISKQGEGFKRIHYQMLMDCYISASPPDLKRAISILTIMTLEKLEPSQIETRGLYALLHNEPALVSEGLQHLRELHDQGRRIPIAALNLLIECYVEQTNLAEALQLYKIIHTFVPARPGAEGKSFANIETFNLMLKGCRRADPPNEELASFLVSELLALRVKPTALTYDRLILVYLTAGGRALTVAANAATVDASSFAALKQRAVELFDWAFRHFVDMQAVVDETAAKAGPLGWMPRFGTLRGLARELANVGDSRCWDVVQTGEDKGHMVAGWAEKGKSMRREVEQRWADAMADRKAGGPEGDVTTGGKEELEHSIVAEAGGGKITQIDAMA